MTIEKNSFLYRATGAAELQVNSMHHQAVDTLAPMFHATAFAPDGVIEAYEADGDRLIAGIQWHPEMMDESVQQSICRAFVDRCRGSEREIKEKCKRRGENLRFLFILHIAKWNGLFYNSTYIDHAPQQKAKNSRRRNLLVFFVQTVYGKIRVFCV